ncbi:MAG: ferrous iron transport protein B, partial [Kiritimatiellales bacterium]|nr:ferrous iron transport protein B [Kiritimatiellales bacterium]
TAQLPADIKERGLSARWAALKLLEHDEWALDFLGSPVAILEAAKEEITRVEKHIGEDLDIIIADGRYGFIHGLTQDVIQRDAAFKGNITEAIDKIVLNRLLGIPVFFFVMYMVFAITMNVGGPFIGFFDRLCGAVFVDGFGHLLAAVHTPEWLTTLLANGLGGGIQTVSTFIPPIFFIFLCLSFLEDSGYMARAAFVMDRFLRAIGLPGKAFIPMLVGFGCNVPGIMATRTLENNRDRILSILINPFMSCGARLPVYTLFAAAFFPESGGILIFAIYMTGIFLAVITGLLFKRTILQGDVSTFVMELPHYHMPTLNGIMFHTWTRLKGFIIRAGKVILVVVVILSCLSSIGTDGTIGNDNSGNSILCAVSRKITPVFRPLGIKDENWPATVGLFTGIFAKEAVVGTLDSLYSQIGAEETGTEEEVAYSFLGSIADAFAAIPAGFDGFFKSMTDPLGVSSAMHEIDSSDQKSYSVMVQRFGDGNAAIAYLLFILIYAPCVAAIAAIYRETSLGWAAFAVFYLTVLAWTVATGFYQMATFAAHPLSSALWLAFCVFLAAGGYAGLVLHGRGNRVSA